MSTTAALVGQFGTVQSKYLGPAGSIHGLIHAVNVLPPSSDSQTSASHDVTSLSGSFDFHSTLNFCPGWRTYRRRNQPGRISTLSIHVCSSAGKCHQKQYRNAYTSFHFSPPVLIKRLLNTPQAASNYFIVILAKTAMKKKRCAAPMSISAEAGISV